MKTSLLLLAALVAAPFASAQQALEISEKGVLTAGNTTWRTLFMDQKWRPLTQDKHFVVESSVNGNFQGKFQTSPDQSLFDFNINYVPMGTGYQIASEVSNPDGVQCKMLAYQGTLKTDDFSGKSILLDGKPIELPLAYGKANVAMKYAYSVSVPTSAGNLVFKGGFDVLIVDARKYDDTKFFVRLMYSPNKGEIRSSKLEAKVTLD